MQELKDVLRMVREEVGANPPPIEVKIEMQDVVAETTGEMIVKDIKDFVQDMYNNDQSFEHDIIKPSIPAVEPLPVTEDTPKPLSREELKKSISLYRQELSKAQEAIDFANREKPVGNINAHNAATSKTGKKLSAKQIKSKQVTNMRKVGLLAGLFKVVA